MDSTVPSRISLVAALSLLVLAVPVRASDLPAECTLASYGNGLSFFSPVVVTETLTCAFRCDAGDALTASAAGTSIRVTASCGGVKAVAGSLLPVIIVAGAGPVPEGGIGTCTLQPSFGDLALPAAVAYEAGCGSLSRS